MKQNKGYLVLSLVTHIKFDESGKEFKLINDDNKDGITAMCPLFKSYRDAIIYNKRNGTDETIIEVNFEGD